MEQFCALFPGGLGLLRTDNNSYRIGKKQLRFDAVAERFADSDEANRFLKPAYRKNYQVLDAV